VGFREMVESFGDIIFNFEYRRMVTDFFHPTHKTTPSTLKKHSPENTSSSEEEENSDYERHMLIDGDDGSGEDESESEEDYYDEEGESSSGEGEGEEEREPAAYKMERRVVKR